ncbi:MAG: FAD-dependent thymidylate synthase [Nanoarchaeota archaeon]
MDVKLIASTGDLQDARSMLEFGLRCARICYTAKDWDELQKEQVNEELLDDLLNSGHHSVFEHINLRFNFSRMPKAMAMVFNNEKQYATSEKSARYTVMSGMEPQQKVLYDKWIEKLIPAIEKVYPEMQEAGEREAAIKKLAQENARYMTSVFTPTKMVHTVNLRQLNFLQQQFESFIAEYSGSGDEFRSRLASEMQSFLDQARQFRIEKLDNQTDRGLSMFSSSRLSPKEVKGDVYSTAYPLSFAGLAQAHRHRTISYNILNGLERGAKMGFYVPPIVSEEKMEDEWASDLGQVAVTDYPQAQLLQVYERGRLEDFRSKAMLRMCGHAQLEIMMNTLATAKGYEAYQNAYGNKKSLKPKCMQGYKCAKHCVWTGNMALERLV